MKFARFLSVCCLFFGSCYSNAVELYADKYQPEFRTAEEILNKISPLLSRESKVSIVDGALLFRATREDILNLENVLTDLDRPVQEYVVSISNRKEVENYKSSYEINGLVPVGRQGGVRFDGKYSTKGNIKYSKSGEQDKPSSQIAATEDKTRFIKISNDTKVKIKRTKVDEKTQKVIGEEIVYRLYKQGFYLTIERMSGDNLALNVSPFLGGRTSFLKSHQHEVMTSIYCKEGSWVKLSFSSSAFDQNYSEAISPEDIDIWVKVDNIR